MKKQILAILKEMAGGVPEEFQLLPYGTIAIEGEPPAQLTDEAAQSILKAFERRGNDLVIDYEHQTLKDVEAPAAGWIKQLVWRGMEGLWAKVEWTERAKKYLESREYRYFSPVFFVNARDRTVAKIEHVALTNYPKLNNLKPIMAKSGLGQYRTEEDDMDKLKKLLGLAADAAEEKISEAVELLVNKCRDLEGKQAAVACKELLEALGAKADAGKDEVLRIVAGMKTPATVAIELSQEVARLKTKISEMEQQDLVQLALKEGKTSPEELDKWGRDLALKSPEQFRLIVLSRPAGSVIPVSEILIAKDQTGAVTDEVQQQVNRMMGVSEETFKKYNK
jgi:phage I-like protein